MLCIQTTLPAGGNMDFAGDDLKLEIVTSLTYADGPKWTSVAPTMSISQKVNADPFLGIENMGCADWGTGLDLSFPSGLDQNRSNYRVLLARQGHLGSRVVTDISVSARLIGSSLYVNIRDSEAKNYVHSDAGGLGNAWVIVEHRASSEAGWETATVRQVHLKERPLINYVDIECSWPR